MSLEIYKNYYYNSMSFNSLLYYGNILSEKSWDGHYPAYRISLHSPRVAATFLGHKWDWDSSQQNKAIWRNCIAMKQKGRKQLYGRKS